MYIFHFEQKNGCPLLQAIQPNVSAQLSCSLLDNWALLYDDFYFTLEMKSQSPIAENGYLIVWVFPQKKTPPRNRYAAGFAYTLKLAEKPYVKRFWGQKKSTVILSKLRWTYGGVGGIRTHVPVKANGFRDRPVMTASIPLRMKFFRPPRSRRPEISGGAIQI